MSVPKILFINRESSRSGAPLLLLSFIKWLLKNNIADPIILINRKGSLDGEFSALGKTFFFYQKKSSINRGIGYKLYCRWHNSDFWKDRYLSKLKRKLSAEKPDLIYSNSIGNGELLEFCSFLVTKKVTHVHESLYLIDLFGGENFEQVKKHTSHFIACSDIVKRDLQTKSISGSAISLVYASVDTGIVHNAKPLTDKHIVQALKKNYSIIGGSGGSGWVKGMDFIIPLVQEIKKSKNDILFVWVGGDIQSAEFLKLAAGVVAAGLQTNIYFTGQVTNAIDYFCVFELFVLLSRTDSFPLVCLENALIGSPFVCFRDCSGIQVILEDGMDENVITYPDITKMAGRILQLIDDKAGRDNMGTLLKKMVVEKYSNDVCFPQLLEVIDHNM